MEKINVNVNNVNLIDVIFDQEKKNPIQIENVVSQEKIEDLGSAITWEGLIIDYNSLNDLFNWIEQYTPVKVKKIYVTKGYIMNQLYSLTGNNAYDDQLNIVSVNLSDLEHPENIIFHRFEVHARWLDDIVNINLSNESKN